MPNIISEKQAKFLEKQPSRLNILTGAVSSGKTWISLIGWAFFVASCPNNYEFIMCGKTVTSLKRNCLGLLQDQVGTSNFTYSMSSKSGMLFGHRIWIEGANDERSEGKIRGMTLGGAYCDELTLFPEGFYMMLLSRLRMPNAKFFATTNPDAPTNWVNTEIIENEKVADQLTHWHFLIEDNDHNDPKFVKAIKESYSGVFYDRYILGLWKVAEGLVYPMFDKQKHVLEERFMPHNSISRKQEAQGIDPYEKYWISCDYGTMNPSAFILWGKVGPTYYAIKEYYYDGRKKEPRTDEEHYAALAELAGNREIRHVIVDPSAASFITLVKRKKHFRILEADNTVIDGIRECATSLKRGQIKIGSMCENFIQEIQIYAWNEKKPEDTVIKESDHAMDAWRYFIKTLNIADLRKKVH